MNKIWLAVVVGLVLQCQLAVATTITLNEAYSEILSGYSYSNYYTCDGPAGGLNGNYRIVVTIESGLPNGIRVYYSQNSLPTSDVNDGLKYDKPYEFDVTIDGYVSILVENPYSDLGSISVLVTDQVGALSAGGQVGIAVAVTAAGALFFLLACCIGYRMEKAKDIESDTTIHTTSIVKLRIVVTIALFIIGIVWFAIGYSIDLIWMKIIGPIAFVLYFALQGYSVVYADKGLGVYRTYSTYLGFLKSKTEINLKNVQRFQMGTTTGKHGTLLYRMEAMMHDNSVVGLEVGHSNMSIDERQRRVQQLNNFIGAVTVQPVLMVQPVVYAQPVYQAPPPYSQPQTVYVQPTAPQSDPTVGYLQELFSMYSSPDQANVMAYYYGNQAQVRQMIADLQHDTNLLRQTIFKLATGN